MQTSLPALSAYHLSGSICSQELKDILFFPHKIIVERKKIRNRQHFGTLTKTKSEGRAWCKR